MEPAIEELLRMKRFDALASVVEKRFGIAPTAESLQWLHEIAFHRSTQSVGGTTESRWSNSTWLIDAAYWLLDPGAEPHDGEWPAGRWAAWQPAMSWTATSFAELIARELRTLRE
jgi:hypothetical protein